MENIDIILHKQRAGQKLLPLHGWLDSEGDVQKWPLEMQLTCSWTLRRQTSTIPQRSVKLWGHAASQHQGFSKIGAPGGRREPACNFRVDKKEMQINYWMKHWVSISLTVNCCLLLLVVIINYCLVIKKGLFKKGLGSGLTLTIFDMEMGWTLSFPFS